MAKSTPSKAELKMLRDHERLLTAFRKSEAVSAAALADLAATKAKVIALEAKLQVSGQVVPVMLW